MPKISHSLRWKEISSTAVNPPAGGPNCLDRFETLITDIVYKFISLLNYTRKAFKLPIISKINVTRTRRKRAQGDRGAARYRQQPLAYPSPLCQVTPSAWLFFMLSFQK